MIKENIQVLRRTKHRQAIERLSIACVTSTWEQLSYGLRQGSAWSSQVCSRKNMRARPLVKQLLSRVSELTKIFLYLFIFYKDPGWSTIIRRDILLKATRESHSIVLVQERRRFSFHRQTSHFCQRHSGRQLSNLSLEGFASPSLHKHWPLQVPLWLRRMRMMNMARTFWILYFDKSTHMSARMFSDPTRGKRDSPGHITWWPGRLGFSLASSAEVICHGVCSRAQDMYAP